MSVCGPVALTKNPPVAYSAAIPAASCLLKLSAYAEPSFSTSCLRSAAPTGTENAVIKKHKTYGIRMTTPSPFPIEIILVQGLHRQDDEQYRGCSLQSFDP